MNNSKKKQYSKRLTNIADIKEIYENIEQCNALEVSPNIKFKHLGGSAQIIQLLCTWQRTHSDCSIVLNKQTNIESTKFEKNEVLLVAFYIAKEVLQSEKEIRKKVLKGFIPFVMGMHELSSGQGREHKYLFFQGARNEFLIPFYENKIFRQESDVLEVIGQLIRTSASAISDGSFSGDLECIRIIIYELLSNTDKHGRRDVDNIEILKNVRGLFIDIHDFSNENRMSFVKNQVNYAHFLTNVKQVLAISIFDSGEGIVRMYKGIKSNQKENYMTFEEKEKVLKEVFLPGASSSEVRNSGMGLTYVEECIKKLRGLLSIKTDTLEYFLSPTIDGEYEDMCKECLPCVGTSIVALIPLKMEVSNEQ